MFHCMMRIYILSPNTQQLIGFIHISLNNLCLRRRKLRNSMLSLWSKHFLLNPWLFFHICLLLLLHFCLLLLLHLHRSLLSFCVKQTLLKKGHGQSSPSSPSSFSITMTIVIFPVSESFRNNPDSSNSFTAWKFLCPLRKIRGELPGCGRVLNFVPSLLMDCRSI